MKAYRDIDGDSGVAAYEYGPDWIRVEFKTRSVYEYTYASAGQNKIETMRHLADSGEGLNAFIEKNVKKLYSRRVR